LYWKRSLTNSKINKEMGCRNELTIKYEYKQYCCKDIHRPEAEIVE